jgi:hypothetical protein
MKKLQPVILIAIALLAFLAISLLSLRHRFIVTFRQRKMKMPLKWT